MWQHRQKIATKNANLDSLLSDHYELRHKLIPINVSKLESFIPRQISIQIDNFKLGSFLVDSEFNAKLKNRIQTMITFLNLSTVHKTVLICLLPRAN